jgi:pimeloyl-ACP methyl ester carboxylesterase
VNARPCSSARRSASVLLALAATIAGAMLYGAPSASAAPPEFVDAPCPDVGRPDPALEVSRCGYLVVPQNRANPDGPTVRVPVAIVPAKSPNPAPDPLVYMGGGPGLSPIPSAHNLVEAGLNDERDLIIVDQRGTRFNEPELFCPELDPFNAKAVDLPSDAPATGRKLVKASAKCYDRLVSEGIDLSAYNTTENAADFADLRIALGIAEWNVYGVSYGTDLALTYMRLHPEGVRSVTIDSVVPPDVATLAWVWTSARQGINNLFRACARQKRCDKAYPKLRRTFTGLVNELEEDPVRTKAKSPIDGERVDVLLDGGALVNWMASVGSEPTGVPKTIEAFANGDLSELAEARAAAIENPLATGMANSVLCSEWAPFASEAEILGQGREEYPKFPDAVLQQPPQLAFMHDVCQAWDVPAAPESFRQLPQSPIPTLVMGGTFDAITGVRWAKYAANRLGNATQITIPGTGHGTLFQSECAQSVFASFLAAPGSADTACVAGLKPPKFDVSRR